jgi:hypothetical protein
MSFRVRNEQVDALSVPAWVDYERRMVEPLQG